MSDASEKKFDLDLHFLPAWAQQGADVNRYAEFEGDNDQRIERRRGGGSDFRRGPRDRGPRREGPPGSRPPGPPESGVGRRPDRGMRRDEGRRFGPERREPPLALPEVEVTLLPEEKGVTAIARQIKLTGRAYPLFDIGYLVLKKPDRYTVRFSVIKKADGQIAQPLFRCSLDETLWLSEQEAMDYVLDRNFSMFYQTEKIPGDPPKGVFTFVAQCGFSGAILGPPNYHDYQNKLRKLHGEKFAHLPFEVYKSRVRIVRDEAVVKKWLEEQSFKTEFLCLNVPDTLKLGDRQEVEKHFRETHLSNVIQPVDFHTLSGVAARSLPSHALAALVHRAFEDQKRFPLKLVTTLSQMFASEGLQFFKVNKSVTHVAVSRPHYLDINAILVSEGVKHIINYIDTHPNTTRRQLLQALAPAPLTPPMPAAAPASAPVGQEPSASPNAAEPAPTDQPAPTEEMRAIISDLHWLIHQGHVIEFANGALETAKPPPPPPPRPPKPAPKAPTPTTAASAPGPAGKAAPGAAAPSEPESESTATPGTLADEASAEACRVEGSPGPEGVQASAGTPSGDSEASSGRAGTAGESPASPSANPPSPAASSEPEPLSPVI